MNVEQAKLEGQAKQRQTEEAGYRLARNLQRQVAEAKPMPVLAGPIGPAVNGIARAVVGEDVDLLAKTKHLRAKNENLLAFMARTGISLHQIINYTRRDLDGLYKVAVQNEMPAPKKHRPIPSNFEVHLRSGQY